MLIMYVKKMSSPVQLGNMVSFLLLLFLVNSCTKWKDFDQQRGNYKGNIEFKIRISNSNQQQEQKATAKPSSKSDYSSKFKAGDSFGLFMVPAGSPLQSAGNLVQNAEVTFDGSSWSSEVVWPDGETNFDCYAYYPYDARVTNPSQMNFTVKLNQSDSTDFSASDLLWAKSTGVARESALEFTFAHLLSMLQVEVPLGDLKGNGPDHLLKINLLGVQTSGRLSLENGSFSNEVNSINSVTFYRVEQATDVNYESSFTYRAYLPVQELTGKKKIKLSQGKQTQLMELNANLSLTAGGSKRIEVKSEMFQTSYIPSGTFQMGASEGDLEAMDDEKPRHWVKLTKGFYMGKYEVTVAQFTKFLNAIGAQPVAKNKFVVSPKTGLSLFYNLLLDFQPKWNNNVWEVRAEDVDLPMTLLPLNGAIEYAEWVGGALPSEAQWEYACRAGTNTIRSFGDNVPDLEKYAWYNLNPVDYMAQKVGQKKPNPWGLFDMYGNAGEFVLDNFESFEQAGFENEALVDPIISNLSGKIITRGGTVYQGSDVLRSSKRNSFMANQFNIVFGFRIIFPE